MESGTKASQTATGEVAAPSITTEEPTPVPESVPSTKGKQRAADEAEVQADEPKKSVKFADDIQVQEFATPPVIESTTHQALPKKLDPSLVSGSFSSKDRVIELDDDDEIIGSSIPEDESPEDARLRREMLQYGLNEVGSVVAELELEEDYSDDDEDYDFDDDENISENEDEDEHGRSTGKLVGSKYRQQMLELEEKLMARMIENVGPEPDESNPEIDPEDLRRLVIRKDEEMPSSNVEEPVAKPKDPSTKKGVRFSDVLDIQEAPKPKGKQPASRVVPKKAAPIIENVMERKAPGGVPAAQEAKKPAKVSRFKQDRTQEPSQPSTEATQEPATIKEEDRPILSNSIVERPATTPTGPPQDPDELDPEIQQRQLASEYYRMRNSMIRQQGGFKMTEEDIERPLMEERDGKVKKVSRFKAARLGK